MIVRLHLARKITAHFNVSDQQQYFSICDMHCVTVTD